VEEEKERELPTGGFTTPFKFRSEKVFPPEAATDFVAVVAVVEEEAVAGFIERREPNQTTERSPPNQPLK
jgi:hypothetical protein